MVKGCILSLARNHDAWSSGTTPDGRAFRAGSWPDARQHVRFLESGNSLRITGTAVESSQRPTVAVGASSFGKSRLCRKPLFVGGYSHTGSQRGKP